jgi:DHA2 family multidrug resistance protein
MPFFFVSLSYVTMAYVPNPQMNTASAIFNLLRNLGGSFGVAFVTTMVARRTQFHQARLIEHLDPYSPGIAMRMKAISAGLAGKLGEAFDLSRVSAGIVYRSLIREATAMAFYDAFFLQACFFVALLGLLWIMKKPPMGKAAPSAH